MHKRERHFAMLNDNRVVRPFEWGTEFITDHMNGDDPRKLFAEHSKTLIENSDEFFFKPDVRDYSLQSFPTYKRGVAAASADGVVPSTNEARVLTWTSSIETPSP